MVQEMTNTNLVPGPVNTNLGPGPWPGARKYKYPLFDNIFLIRFFDRAPLLGDHWINERLNFLTGLKSYLKQDIILFLYKLSYLIAPNF